MQTYPLTNLVSQRTLVVPKLPRISFRFLLVLGFAFIGFLLIFYLFQINGVAKTSFLISKYEKEISNFSKENKELEISFSQHNFLTDLEIHLKNLNYVNVDKIHYIQVLEGGVAVKR